MIEPELCINPQILHEPSYEWSYAGSSTRSIGSLGQDMAQSHAEVSSPENLEIQQMSRNARAQARHRAKCKAYIEKVSQFTSLPCMADDSL
jgi:hypothetical protein